jgi:hypothetical protein
MVERESGSVASESFGRRGQKCGLTDSRTENQTVVPIKNPIAREVVTVFLRKRRCNSGTEKSD